MGETRFIVGDLVRVHSVSGLSTAVAFMDAVIRNSVSGIYEVKAVLSEGGGQPRYRIGRGDNTPEKVVRESQLVLAARKPSV